jgi:hypothetical protein
MPDWRRGVAAVKEASDNKGTGQFKPYVPIIAWSDDKEEKYVLLISDLEEITTVKLHRFVELGESERNDGSKYKKFGFYISRKDPAIGEDYDLLEDRNGFTPQEHTMGVAVELEPVMKEVGGRQKPKGFKVLTQEYERRIDPNDEESAKETVTSPVVGVVSQSPNNFFGYLVSYNEDEGPVNETPFKIKRRGKDKNTEYDFVPYDEIEVDLSDLVQNIDGISYLNDVMDELVEHLADADDQESAQIIAHFLLTQRLDELADKERYEEEVGPLEDLKPRYPKGDKKKGGKRPERKSQRSSSNGSSKKSEPEVDEGRSETDAKRARFEEIREKAQKRRKVKSGDSE